MRILLIIIGVIFGIIVLFIIWRLIATNMATIKRDEALAAAVNPIASAIKNNSEIPTDQVFALAKRTDTRSLLFRVLHELKRPELMPKEYTSPSSIAESDLVAWLLHPNELGAVPDEIELVKEIEREEGDPPEQYTFYIFKFRTKEPHWSADDGWIAGVAGPYWKNELPLHSPPGVFSRFESIDSDTPEEHLRKTEELVLSKFN